jgi:hypothetical protein
MLLLEKQIAAIKGQVRQVIYSPYFSQLVCFLGQTAQLPA